MNSADNPQLPEEATSNSDVVFIATTLEDTLGGTNRGSRELVVQPVAYRSFSTIADTVLSLGFDQDGSGEYVHSWEKELETRQLVVGTTAFVSTSLSVGYVIWILRGGALTASFFSAIPAWCAFDPLPIVDSFAVAKSKKEDELQAESLTTIVASD